MKDYIRMAYNVVKRIVAVVIVGLIKFLVVDYPKNIWIFGGCARKRFSDNASVMFDYVVNNTEDIRAYWVIAKSSEDRELVTERSLLIGNTVKANIAVLLSQVIITSHGLYDVSGYKKRFLKNKLNVFLSHGIFCLKRASFDSMKDFYDIVLVNSEHERGIKHNLWGVANDRIVECCLPRFDALKKYIGRKPDGGKTIFYMPTWRDWLVKGNGEPNEFFSGISKFLHNKDLHEILKKSDIILKVFIHINMQDKFKNQFESLAAGNIEILDVGADVQRQLIDCDLFITDYSSVIFDVLYLEKPSIIYAFDKEHYDKHRGMYIDSFDSFFSGVTFNHTDLILKIKEYADSDFKISTSECKNIVLGKRKYMEFDRDSNCEYLLEEIKHKLS